MLGPIFGIGLSAPNGQQATGENLNPSDGCPALGAIEHDLQWCGRHSRSPNDILRAAWWARSTCALLA